MSTIDDLLSQRRRGGLNEADERRLQMAVQTSREYQLTLLAGEAFDRAGAPRAGDAALIRNIVQQVEGEWSGTFQRVVARRRLSRWVSVPVLTAGLAAASFGGYRAVSAPGANSAAVRVAAAPPTGARLQPVLSETPPERAAVALPAAALSALPEVAEPAPPVVAAGDGAPLDSAAMGTAATDTAATDTAATDTAATGSDGPVALVEPAPARRAATSSAAAVASSASPAAHSGANWNLPRPKPRAVHALAHDLEPAAVLPAPPLSESTSSGSAAEAAPDFESAQALFRRANRLRQTDWDAAATLYERLALRHSEAAEAGVAEMALGKHALADGRASQALKWFQAYQRREGGALGAEALWGEARALQSLGEGTRAQELWQRLIEQYPASAYAAAAREQLGP